LVDAAALKASVHGDSEVTITEVTIDSRAVQLGALFCCIPGANVDGHDFAHAAVSAGAAALLVERLLPIDVPQVLVTDVRASVGPLAATCYGDPSRDLLLVGVTGTNGKTTTSALIAAILRANGLDTAVIGTLTGVHTTPEAPDLQRQLVAHRAEGKHAVVMEVSSHALALHRVDGCQFALAVFTNLGSDHMDLHETPERYFAAKAMLFTAGLSAQGISNGDDLHGRLLADAAEIPMTVYTRDDVSGVSVTSTAASFEWRGQTIEIPMGGAFNVDNALAAATAGAVLGVDTDTIRRGLAAVDPVAGRFEHVAAVRGADVIVDFAHTPEGLTIALDAARQVSASGRVIVVFGAGGDRDRSKRPLMGHAAAKGADVVIVTSDNPRTEDPLDIIGAIVAGIDERTSVIVEPDRRTAIATGLRQLASGDVLVVAGKGHERTQTTGTKVVEFDDRATVLSIIEEEL